MTTTKREFVDATSDVIGEIDRSQNYINRESVSVDNVIELLRTIRDRLEPLAENLIGD